MSKIAILGANGQVGAEVSARLSGYPGVAVIPCSRTRNGSAFLRSRGIPVRHGGIATLQEGRALLGDADLVANFALAAGVGRRAVSANNQVIEGALRAAPHARHVFFSTLAVNGSWGPSGHLARDNYGALKLANERHFLRTARAAGVEAWVCRLGHVLGHWQNLEAALREEARNGPIAVPDPDRHANVTHVETICEALVAIARGLSAPGRYDLVDCPPWSWRDVYTRIAGETANTLAFIELGSSRRGGRADAGVFNMIARLGLRPRLERLLTGLPSLWAERIKANYMVNRAVGEIAALRRVEIVRNMAAWWPALPVRPMRGPRFTVEVIRSGDFALPHGLHPWPSDIAPAWPQD